MSAVLPNDSKAVALSDPTYLQGIPPALLNSADIEAYATQLEPKLFEPFNKKYLKPATYEIPFEGDLYFWSDAESALISPLQKIPLAKDGQFTIPPNSIVYVSPATVFRVPHFLALRFNLTIKLVHRGLLLGTGPLVDPGFAGRLLIPLHNLTSQSFVVCGDEGFIWVEVTKISPVRTGTVQASFPPDKRERSAREYFRKANQLRPIVSTLAVTAQKLDGLFKTVEKVSVYGALGLLVAGTALIYGSWSLLNDTHHYVTDTYKATSEDLSKVQKRQDELQVELDSLKKTMSKLAPKNIANPGAEKAIDSKDPTK
jgi:deoxycytidine triphosphate deaminase